MSILQIYDVLITYSNVWSSWDDINGPVDDSTFLHDDFMILFWILLKFGQCPNFAINQPSFFFSTAYRRWHVPDSFPKTSSWKIAFWPTKLRVTNHQQSQSDDTYQKSRDLFFSHFQPSDFMGEIQASTSLLVAGDATLHNEHEGKSMEVRSQLLVDDVPQAGEPKRVNMFER